MLVKNNVIFAPHIDDEVIGCWRLLNFGTVASVYYFFDITSRRLDEAENVAKHFGFSLYAVKLGDRLDIPEHMTIHLPNIADAHLHHKLVNYYGKSLPNPKKYYSVDMNVPFDVLSEQERRQKLDALSRYPSQSKLLTSDDKYSLFESSLDSDIQENNLYQVDGYTISMSGPLVSPALIKENIQKSNSDIEKIIAAFPMRYIRILYGSKEFIFTP